MKHLDHINPNTVMTTMVSVLALAFIQGSMISCATASGIKGSGITASQEATDQWHSFEILPNYNYYYVGGQTRPNYLIAIDKQYSLTSKLWKPIDLTPEQLKKWIDIPPRVGYDPQLYGADIKGPNGEQIGLWYSVRDWRDRGSASLGENNQVSVTIPITSEDRRRRGFGSEGAFDF